MNEADENKIDCIQMKREIQSRIYEDTKNMTHEEFLRHIRKTIASSRFAKYIQTDRSAEQAT